MTRHEGDDHPDPVLDWALTERLGRAAPPDLAAGVHQRLAAAATQGRSFALAGSRSSRQQWLAAAMVLLGTLVVVGVALWRQSSRSDGGDAGQAPAAEVQEPTPVPVRSAAAAVALPDDTRAVEVVDGGDEVVSALLGKRKLEVLVLTDRERITDGGIETLAQLSSLRRLELRRMRGLTSACVPSLRSMASLRELDLRQLGWVTADVVAQLRRTMPGLERLQSDAFDRDVEAALASSGMATARDIESLRGLPASTVALQLRNGGDQAMSELVRLTNLTVLELVHRPLQEVERAVRRDRSAGAPTVEGLSVLRSLRQLRELRLVAQPTASEELLGVVRQVESLRVLQLANMVVTDKALALLAGMPLVELSLTGCRGFGAEGMRVVAGLRGLRRLRIHAPDGMPSEGLRALAELPHLEELELDGLGGRSGAVDRVTFRVDRPGDGHGFTAVEAAAIARIASLRRLSLSRLAVQADEVLRPLAVLPALVTLELSQPILTAAALDRLPTTLQRLRVVGGSLQGTFGDALAKGAPALSELDLVDCRELGDAGLRSLRAVTSLRRLDLSGCQWVSVDAITSLEQLEELVVRDMPRIDTEAMQLLRAMPRLRWLTTDRVREKLR